LLGIERKNRFCIDGVGAQIGPYTLLRLIAEGGMGAVYRAHDTKLNRDVALKVLLPEVADDPERVARFRREAQILVGVVLGRAKLADSANHLLIASRAGASIDPRGELIGLEAVARTLLGERDEAISLLEQYLTNHPDHRAGFAKINTWWWRDLQQEPRFKTLIATAR